MDAIESMQELCKEDKSLKEFARNILSGILLLLKSKANNFYGEKLLTPFNEILSYNTNKLRSKKCAVNFNKNVSQNKDVIRFCETR